MVYGQMTNRIVVDKPITVVASGGPSVTHLVGERTANGGIRVVYLGSGAGLFGFTVRDGSTRRSGDSIHEQSGGGVFCEPSSIVSNCVIIRNYAHANGGGVRGGLIHDSTIASNDSYSGGGGLANSTVYNSTVESNRASYGGGLYYSVAHESILSNNVALSEGGGARRSTLMRSLIIHNLSLGHGGGTEEGLADCCRYDGNSANAMGGGAYNE